MPVIGTAGHVDHGKTALILALTGIDTDRLVEEKTRGMTTDLGYAHFDSEELGAIGVVDVPGHERFIRNMVAGASAIDGAIFVVAADDGWMEQTERHLAVLSALEVPILAVALTKADLANVGRRAEVALDCIRRLEAARAKTPALDPSGETDRTWPACVPVDNLRKTGVEELRTETISRLTGLFSGTGNVGYGRTAALFIDRVFTLKNAGLIVAGTLRGSALRIGDVLTLIPEREEVKIKGIQLYGKTVEQAEPHSRVALSITRPKTEPRRGSLLVARSSVWSSPEENAHCSKDLYLRILQKHGKLTIRPGTELEFALGTAHRFVKLWPSRSKDFLRAETDSPLAFFGGARAVILRKGGADTVAVVEAYPSPALSRDERRRQEPFLARCAGLRQQPGPRMHPMRLFRLALDGRVPAPVERIAPEATAAAPVGPAEDRGLPFPGLIRLGKMDFLPEALDEALQAYLKHCPAEGYIKAEIPGAALGLDPITAAALAERLAQKGSLIRDAGRYGLPQKIDPPSGRAAEILQALQKANGESWDLDRDGRGGDRKEIGTLCARGLAIALDSSLFVSAHGYADYCGRILQGRPVGSAFTLGDAKSATGLSRKWIIPLLNRMERDGLVERDGETRRVLKKGTAGA